MSGSPTSADLALLEELPADLALIALGSNLGDRRAHLEGALTALDQQPDCRVVARSSWHTTAPVGGPAGQGDFLNGVALLETSLEPVALLELLHRIELAFERVRGVPNGPRTLDLDLLMIGDQQRGPDATSALELPHPRLHERLFVLEPLAELTPLLGLPDGARVAERLAALVAEAAR